MNHTVSSQIRPTAAAVVGIASALLLLAGRPAPAQVSPPPDIQVKGEARDDGFGRGVARAGDVDGDGFEDYIFGADGDDDAGTGAGEAYLFYGPLGHKLRARNADAKITGESALDGLGGAVSSAGDVNGDGFDDLLIGARSNDTRGTQAGRAYLFHGPLEGVHGALEADAIISGDPFDEMGWSVAPAGDVNGDGFDDVLVGAWMADLVGEAFLFLGPLDGELTPADADASVTGVTFHEELGDAVTAGDLDDDGIPDLVLGAPRPPVNGADPGSVYVFFGPVSGNFAANQADAIVSGETDGDDFGTAVGVGDVNGDGVDDLLVGADQLFSNGAGKVYVFHGPLAGVISAATADAVLLGEVSNPQEGDLFGQAVASPGDTDGDGLDDVLVGAPSNAAGGTRAGRIYLFHRPLTGTIEAATADRIATGSAYDRLGTTVAAAGDADRDGLGDLLVGAPQFFGENDFGYAGLYLGEGTAAVTPLLTRLTGQCGGNVTLAGSGFAPDGEVALLRAQNTNGFTKGGTLCGGVIFEIGEPITLPPVLVTTDGAGSFETTLETAADRCFVEALDFVSCETSNALDTSP